MKDIYLPEMRWGITHMLYRWFTIISLFLLGMVLVGLLLMNENHTSHSRLLNLGETPSSHAFLQINPASLLQVMAEQSEQDAGGKG